jgi:hypothetical protein
MKISVSCLDKVFGQVDKGECRTFSVLETSPRNEFVVLVPKDNVKLGVVHNGGGVGVAHSGGGVGVVLHCAFSFCFFLYIYTTQTSNPFTKFQLFFDFFRTTPPLPRRRDVQVYIVLIYKNLRKKQILFAY